jgi:CHAT domain-containing protein
MLNSALVQIVTGEYDKGERLLEEASGQVRKSKSKAPGTATILIYIASVYLAARKHDKAEPLFKEAIEILEEIYGPNNIYLAPVFNQLARFHRSLGDYDKAEPLFRKALAIYEERLGSDHPYVSYGLNELASLYAETNDLEHAYKLFKRGMKGDNSYKDFLFGFDSDLALGPLLARKHYVTTFLYLVTRYGEQNSTDTKHALNIWLKRKGEILEVQRRFQHAFLHGADPEATQTFNQLSRAYVQLSKLAYARPRVRERVSYKKNILNLKAKKEKLERKLIELNSDFALSKKIGDADCEKVARRLPAESVLIDFARVGILNFQIKAKEKDSNPVRYIAFLVRAGNGKKIELIDLGDAREIDGTVALFRKSVANKGQESVSEVIRSSRRLYDLLFKPLKKDIGNARRILISPDGNLNIIPFEALLGPDDKYLIEDYAFIYLPAGRDILAFGQSRDKGEMALFFGDPDYDMLPDAKRSILRKLGLKETRETAAFGRSSQMSDVNFARLPDTSEELNTIGALTGEEMAEVYVGKKALEEVLRQRCKQSKIIHLATPCFFLGDLLLSDMIASDLSYGSVQNGMSIPQEMTAANIDIDNPLVRSGVMLSGANYALSSRDPEETLGIVTAEKILALRLPGTDLVVLSACDTGIGDVNIGDGIYGLRRAFTQAGAKSVVMNLWLVPERERTELMVEFYKNFLSGKMNRSQAIRQAALKEMKTVKKRYGHTNPLFWGAFVFIGEP